MSHGAELARFIGDGETRQLYALDRRSGRIVYLPEGEADRFKDDCRTGHLICPIETCPSRSFVAHGGTKKRHHFHHKVRTAAHESYHHQLGKLLLGQHLQDRHPEARVVVDHEAIDNGQRPDVLVEFRDGRRFAFELQLSALPLDVWKRRHDGYRRQRILDVWIFGHLPPQLRPSRYHSEQRFAWTVELHELAQAIARTGAPVLFFNPDERQLATATIDSGEHFLRSWDAAELVYDDLEDCEIRGRRFWTPSAAIEHAARIERRKWTIEARKRLASEQAVELRRLADQLAKQEQEREFAAQLVFRRAAQQQAWQQAAPEFLRLVGLGAVPAIINIKLKTDWATCWHPAHWHARLFYKFIEGRLGETFSYAEARRRLFKTQPYGKRRAYVGLRAYLFELRRRGYLHFDSDRHTIYDPILVLADLHHPPSELLARELLRGRLALDGDTVVFASAEGRILQRLRARRDGDNLETVQTLRAREQERRGRLAAHEYMNDPRQSRDGSEAVVIERVDDGITLSVSDDAWSSLRPHVLALAAHHSGNSRLRVSVYPRSSGPIRDITLSARIEASDDFISAVGALAGRRSG